MIAVIDYGVGNLFSLRASLERVGLESVVTGERAVLEKADKIILPGVGAFGDAINKLKESGLFDTVVKQARSGKPLLGICLGMQLLFEKSYEYGEHQGLGLIEGEIAPLDGDIDPKLKVPQMGWNSLHILKPADPIMKYTREGDYVYYVHSFYAKHCEKSLIAVSDYGVSVPGVVRQGSVWGTQFHPEKSGNVGLSILRAFGEMEGSAI